MDSIDKAIKDAWEVATSYDLSSASDKVKEHYRISLKRIVKATLDAVRKDQNEILYAIEKHIKY